MTQNDATFLAFFPVFFVGLWLVVTTMLGVISGWFDLQRRFPDPGERALVKLGMQSGSMGLGVHFNGVLTLSACPSGLRIAVWRIFGPFERPFVVPWRQIDVEMVTRFFQPAAKLRFSGGGVLTVNRDAWRRLSDAAAPHAGPNAVKRLEPVAIGDIARAKALQWAIGTALMGTFFLLAGRTNGTSNPLPPIVCYVFPAVVLGLGQLVRFLVEASSNAKRGH